MNFQDYSWEIEVLKNVIQNMENGTTDFEFIVEKLISILDSMDERIDEYN